MDAPRQDVAEGYTIGTQQLAIVIDKRMKSWFGFGSEEKHEQHATCLASSCDTSQ